MRQLHVALGGGYDITIEPGALSRLPECIEPGRKVLIITDDGVPVEYKMQALTLCPGSRLFVAPRGEEGKSLAVFEAACHELLAGGFTRRDWIVALGGGVVGDLAGYVAASWMRGIRYVGVPTTTLSQIDSSIGGKTGLNLSGVKNVLGAFHHPKAVLADTDTLKTLTPRHFSNGLAEAVKAGLIWDPALLDLLETRSPRETIGEIVYRCLLMKKAVVEADEREQGQRRILNFGHTIGHGLESAFGLSGLYHGEAVALGMLPMIEDAALRKRVMGIYARLSLPGSVSFDAEQVLNLMRSDKKSDGDTTTIVTVEQAGKALLSRAEEGELRRRLGRLMV